MAKRPNKDKVDPKADSKESQGKYDVDSILWAKSGPLIYLAKVLKVKTEKNETHLFVHYDHWNKKWDTWVNAADVLPDTPATHELAKKLLAKVKQESKTPGRSHKKVVRDSDDEALVKEDEGSKKKKRRSESADPTVEPEEDEERSQKVSLKIPGQVKKELIHDWESVTKNNRLVTLPRPAGTVSDILADFLKAKVKSSPENEGPCQELCAGIKIYFDKSLPYILLYNQERNQFKEVSKGKKEFVASDVYGAEHLARLFVKMPELLNHTTLSTPELGLLQPKLAEFLKWFTKNPKYFGKQYVSATGPQEQEAS